MTANRATGFPRFIDLAIEILLYSLLAFAPAAYGTSEAWSEAIVLWIGGALAVLLAIRTVLTPAKLDRLTSAIVAIFLAIASFALIPLPAGVTKSLSPGTAETRTQLLGDLPDASVALAKMPISFYSLATRHDLRVVLLAVTVLAAVLIVFRDAQRIRRLMSAIALIGLAIAMLALAQDITGTHRIYWRRGLGNIPAQSGTFVNHSHFSQFMNLSIGAALGLLLMLMSDRSAARRWRDIPWLAGTIVLGLLTIALSLSRGGMLAIIGAGMFTLLILLARRTLRSFAVVLIGLVLLALVALCTVGFDRVAQRMSQLSVFGRVEMVRDASEMIRRYPLTGIGLGAFEWVYPAYNSTNVAGTASHLENEYVQVLAETGAIGFLGVLAFVAMVWWRFARGVRSGAIAAIGLGYGLLAVMIQSLSDYGQHLPPIACLSAVVCGLIINMGRRVDETAPQRSVIPAAIALVVVILLSSWTIRDGERARRGEALFDQADRLDDQTAPPYGQLIEAAASAEPGNAHYLYWSAVYRWRTSDRTPADAAKVLPILNFARTLCPTYAPLYSVLGQIEIDPLSEQALGLSHLHTAARLDTCDPTTWFLAGRAEARRGDFDAAIPLLRRAIDLDYTVMYQVNDLALKQLHKPELAIRAAGDNYYRLGLLGNAMYDLPEYHAQGVAVWARSNELLEEAANRPGASPLLWGRLAVTRAEQHRYADAERAFARASQGDPNTVFWRVGHANALAQMGRVDDAIAEAREIVRMNPEDASARELLDRLAKHPTP